MRSETTYMFKGVSGKSDSENKYKQKEKKV